MKRLTVTRFGIAAGCALALSASVLSACKDEPAKPDVLADGLPPPLSVGGGGAPQETGDSSDAGGTCTDLQVTKAAVDQVAFVDTLPQATGGIVADGSYDLTEARVYRGLGATPGPTGTSYQGALRLTGRRFERVLVTKTNTTAGLERRTSGTITVGGSSASVSLACPSSTDEQLTYSVTNGKLSFLNPQSGEVLVFTPRP